MVTTLLTVLVLAGGGAAQEPQWQAFEGCWRQADQAGAPLMCLRQAGADVLMSTYVDGELKSEQRIAANGVPRQISEGGCSGQETGRWSADGARVYLRATLSCGAGMERITSSILALTGPETLVEVQSLRVGDGTSVRSAGYQLVSESEYPAGFALTAGRGLARETARLQASSALDPADVIEGSREVDAGALEALLAARQAGFALSGSTLKQLAAAGVARSTLDVMVGLSYPQEFRVAAAEPEADRRDDWVSPYYGYDPSYRYDCMGLSYYSSMYCDYRYGWSPYSYYSRYGGGYGGYYGGGYYGGGPIIVVPGDGDEVPGGGGRVGPDGRTRGDQPTRGTARPRNQPADSNTPRSSVSPSSSGSGSRASSGSSGSGSSGGSVSSGGRSSGGASSQGTAKPRG